MLGFNKIVVLYSLQALLRIFVAPITDSTGSPPEHADHSPTDTAGAASETDRNLPSDADQAHIRRLQEALAEERAAARGAYLRVRELERRLAQWLGDRPGYPDLEPFYQSLEERLLGSREERPGRYQVYDPQLSATAEAWPGERCLDLRCGDGVWLGQLRRWGLEAVGVDHRRAKVEACRQEGFNVTLMDEASFLAEQDDSSAVLITGIHMIEHLPGFEDLVELAIEARRVLKPGGRLILESPNPENLTVGASSFYLDPRHRKPFHPETLNRLFKTQGWNDVRALRLVHGRAPEPPFPMPEPEAPGADTLAKVFRLLNNHLLSAPDFALVARKPTPDSLDTDSEVEDLAPPDERS